MQAYIPGDVQGESQPRLTSVSQKTYTTVFGRQGRKGGGGGGGPPVIYCLQPQWGRYMCRFTIMTLQRERERERGLWREREGDRETETQTNRQTDRQTKTKTEGYTDRRRY